MKSIPKPTPGDIWQTDQGSYVLVAGVDSSHVTVCSIAIRQDDTVVAHPRGRKADRLLRTVFSRGLYEYVGVAKAPKAVGK